MKNLYLNLPLFSYLNLQDGTWMGIDDLEHVRLPALSMFLLEAPPCRHSATTPPRRPPTHRYVWVSGEDDLWSDSDLRLPCPLIPCRGCRQPNQKRAASMTRGI
jgi:hypothetical protein